MPFLTIAVVLFLVGVFCGGGLLAWHLTERKNERQRAVLEEQMTRALEDRYKVYQELERGYHRVISRLEQMEQQWAERTRPVMPEHTILRVENPELWDLEREYERRQAEQLAEISGKSQRVVQLMDRLEALEPLNQQLAERDREYVQLEETHRALEETRRERVTELEQRLRELEPFRDEANALREALEAAGREVENWRGQVDAVVLQSAETSAGLQGQIEESQQACAERAAHVAALQEEVAGRDRQLGELHQAVDALRAEVEARESQVFMRDELVREREKQLAAVEEELARTRTERDRKIEELSAHQQKLRELEDSWKRASGQVEQQRSRLAEHLSTFESAQVMLSQLKPLISELESNLTADDARRTGEPAGGVEAEIELEDHPVHVDEPTGAMPHQPEEDGFGPDVEATFDLSVLDEDEER